MGIWRRIYSLPRKHRLVKNFVLHPACDSFFRLASKCGWRWCLKCIVVVSALCAEVEPQARLYTKLRHCLGGDLLDAHTCRQGEVRYTRYTVTVVDYQRFTKIAPVTPRYIQLILPQLMFCLLWGTGRRTLTEAGSRHAGTARRGAHGVRALPTKMEALLCKKVEGMSKNRFLGGTWPVVQRELREGARLAF